MTGGWFWDAKHDIVLATMWIFLLQLWPTSHGQTPHAPRPHVF